MKTSSTPLTPSDIVSSKCQSLSGMGSEIRRMFLLGQELRATDPKIDIIDLSLGNPDLEPPSLVREKLISLLSEATPGAHRYMDNAGFPEVRAFLARELSASEGVEIAPEAVFMTCGAAGALQIVMRTILDADDEVIVLAPYFSEYIPYVSNMGAKPIVVPGDARHLPQPSTLAAALTPRTKAVIVNSPNNPSGVIYPKALMAELVDVLRRHRAKHNKLIHMISDEPYSRLLYRGSERVSVLPMYEGAWVVRSHSKDLGLAGERIGYLAWAPQLNLPQTLPALRNAARALGFVNAPALMQRVLPLVYRASVDVAEYERRTQAFVGILVNGGVECALPGGSFFVFPKAPVPDDRAFCARLLEQSGVLCVPGSGFGVPGFFRCSLTQSLDRVVEAAHRIVRAAHA